jgi:hypothetical protein
VIEALTGVFERLSASWGVRTRTREHDLHLSRRLALSLGAVPIGIIGAARSALLFAKDQEDKVKLFISKSEVIISSLL